MGVKLYKQIAFEHVDNGVSLEHGSARFTDNETLKVTNYNGVDKTVAFLEDLDPSQGGDTGPNLLRFTTNTAGIHNLIHNLNNTQLSVTIQKDDNGEAGEIVLAKSYPTPTNKLNSWTIICLKNIKLHVTIVG